MEGKKPTTAYPCVVVGAGEIQDYEAVSALLEPDAFVICADGGLQHCRGLGLRPHLLVGDLDSLTTAPPAGVELVPLSPDKNYTDSYHGVLEAMERGYHRLLLTGMLGGRLDHTLANLGLLTYVVEQGADALLTDGVCHAHALVGRGERLLAQRPGCYFSLLALAPCQGVTILGGKYPLNDYPLSPWDPRAVSNEFCGTDVTILQQEGVLVILSQPK